jgi:hypothetical protein
MRRSGFRSSIAILLSVFVTQVNAAAPAIGIATASGDFRMEQSRVWGNSTLFDGSTIETGAASSQLALRTGAKLQLATDSRARVFATRLELEKGAGQLTTPVKFEINARGLRVLAGSNSRLSVKLGDARMVEVAAFSGLVRVAGPHGLLLASLAPGEALSFDPQAPGPVTLNGCLLYKEGAYILLDEATGNVVELRGGNLAGEVGNRVQATGAVNTATPTAGAKQVVDVRDSKVSEKGGCLGAATQLGASTSAPTPTGAAPAAAEHTGMSSGAKTGLIIAVIGGGAAGAAIAAKGSSKSSTSP